MTKIIFGMMVVGFLAIGKMEAETTPGLNAYADRGYTLVWSDEFNGPDGSLPDFSDKWMLSTRGEPTWKTFNSPYPELYRINDGCLVLKAMANPGVDDDDSPFLTGAIQTSGKFSFTYGLIEARIKTTPHKGNFPAFWLLPEERTFLDSWLLSEDRIFGGWPWVGEVDIWEQINDDRSSYHTLHGYWTKDTGGKFSNIPLDTSEFHVYGFEWDHDLMKWYVDGNEVFRFSREEYGSPRYHPYPFDAPFYIILDQAVGTDNSWPQPHDPAFEYATYIDYVRVYQKPTHLNSRHFPLVQY